MHEADLKAWCTMSEGEKAEKMALAKKITEWGEKHPLELFGQTIEVMFAGYDEDTYMASLVATSGRFIIGPTWEDLRFVPWNAEEIVKRYGMTPYCLYFSMRLRKEESTKIVNYRVLGKLEEGTRVEPELTNLINQGLKSLEIYRASEAA